MFPLILTNTNLLLLGLLLLIFLALIMHRLHLLALLLMLEALALLTLLWMILSTAHSNPIPLMFMLCPIVCEAAMGLTLFLILMRRTGNDLLKAPSLLKW